MAVCGKINGFDKTSSSLSLCSPVEMLTLLGAAITASVSTLWQTEHDGFAEEKKNVSGENECRSYRKNKTLTAASGFALLHFLQVKQLPSAVRG